MQYREKQGLVNRILCGYVLCRFNGIRYKVYQPTPEVLYEADFLYEDIVNDKKYEGIMGRDQLKNFLVFQGIWTPENETALENIEKNIEGLKIDLYKAQFNTKLQTKLRRQIKAMRETQNAWTYKKHCLDHIAVEGIAEVARTLFVYTQTLTDMDGKLIFEDIDSVDSVFLQRLHVKMQELMIRDAQYRELARTEPWRSGWLLKKASIFPAVPTEEQRILGAYTTMYDNAFENPDCPSDIVINDDDMFDGWMADWRKKQQKKREQNAVEDGKYKDAQQVFIPAQTQAEADRINEMNDTAGKIAKAQMFGYIDNNAGKNIKESEIPSVRQDIVLEAQRAVSQRKK